MQPRILKEIPARTWLSVLLAGVPLAAFVRNRERLLSGTGFAVTDRVIDNHVVSLRKKIEDEPIGG